MNLLARVYNWSVPLEAEALRHAVDLADPQPNERILDVATGTGALLEEVASQVDTPQVIGVDRSRAMLSGVVALRPARRLVVADARDLPFAEASFDVVFAGYLLHLQLPDDRSRVLETISRVLRPGGRLITITVDTQHAVLRSFLSRLPAWTGLRPLDPRIELRRAGFEPVHVQYTSGGWPSLVVLARSPRSCADRPVHID